MIIIRQEKGVNFLFSAADTPYMKDGKFVDVVAETRIGPMNDIGNLEPGKYYNHLDWIEHFEKDNGEYKPKAGVCIHHKCKHGSFVSSGHPCKKTCQNPISNGNSK